MANTQKTAATSIKSTWPLMVGLVILTAVLGAGISAQFIGDSLAVLGIPDPGPLTSLGLPALRGSLVLLSSIAVGSLLLSAFLIPPSREVRVPGQHRRLWVNVGDGTLHGVTTDADAASASEAKGAGASVDTASVGAATEDRASDEGGAVVGKASPAQGSGEYLNPASMDYEIRLLDVDGVIAARTAGWASLMVAVFALVLVPMQLSDVSGQPLSTALTPGNIAIALNQVSAALAFLWVAIIAAITAVGAFMSRKWISQPVLLVLAVCQLVPLGLEGHSAAGGDHDYGTNSYLLHLLFMDLWVGGLVALVAYARRKGPHLVLAATRYSRIAFVSALVMVASGLINAAIRIPFDQWLTTDYGLLITAKAVLLAVLIGLGAVHRRVTVPAIATRPAAFWRLAVGELVVMAAAIAVAIALGRTPPPPPRSLNLNAMDIALGYQLHEAPSWLGVFGMFRYDLIFGTLAIVLTAVYLWALRRVKRRGIEWPWTRTAWFLGGNLMLFVTMCGGIGMYMPAMYSIHMVGHMILTMGVPVFWVLGGPLTLLLAALDGSSPAEGGLREWIVVLMDNPVVRFITHPAVNTLQFLVFFYALYVEPLYSILVGEHAGHLGMNLLFLISGTVYYWELIGVDPVPVKRNPMGKVAWLTGSLPIHMWFGVALMQLQVVLAGDFYRSLALPWQPDLLWDQNVGGAIAWASGQFPLLIVYAVVFMEWFRDDRRQQRAYDVKADSDDDEDLAAYNAMLESMAQGRRDNS